VIYFSQYISDASQRLLKELWKLLLWFKSDLFTTKNPGDNP